jgi:hypothetical protein
MKLIIIGLALFLFFTFELSSQVIENPLVDSVAANSPTDSASSSKFSSINSIMEKEPLKSSSFEMQKSPTGAIIRSIIPGWGQFYNEEYWKTPIFLGAAGGLIGGIVWYNNKFQPLEREYISLKAIPDNKKTNEETDRMSRVKILKEAYRDYRDQFGLYLLGVYIIAAIDAYTGAHLYDFNVDDNMAIYFGSDSKLMGANLNFRLKF